MIQKDLNSTVVYLFENFLKYNDIVHFVSTRIGGYSNLPYKSLNLGLNTNDNPQNVIKNRELLLSKMGISLDRLIIPRQIHSGNVTVITTELKNKGLNKLDKYLETTDAIITNVPQLCLSVLVADCVPMLFFDPKKRVIGVAHAGWKGTVNMIAKNTIYTMQETFSSLPKDILVGIGPSIGPDCYEVGSEVIDKFKRVFNDYNDYIKKDYSGGKGFLNLWEANKRQLLKTGVLKKNIEISYVCNHCHSNIFFSYRAKDGSNGRFGIGIMIK